MHIESKDIITAKLEPNAKYVHKIPPREMERRQEVYATHKAIHVVMLSKYDFCYHVTTSSFICYGKIVEHWYGGAVNIKMKRNFASTI